MSLIEQLAEFLYTYHHEEVTKALYKTKGTPVEGPLVLTPWPEVHEDLRRVWYRTAAAAVVFSTNFEEDKAPLDVTCGFLLAGSEPDNEDKHQQIPCDRPATHLVSSQQVPMCSACLCAAVCRPDFDWSDFHTVQELGQ